MKRLLAAFAQVLTKGLEIKIARRALHDIDVDHLAASRAGSDRNPTKDRPPHHLAKDRAESKQQSDGRRRPILHWSLATNNSDVVDHSDHQEVDPKAEERNLRQHRDNGENHSARSHVIKGQSPIHAADTLTVNRARVSPRSQLAAAVRSVNARLVQLPSS